MMLIAYLVSITVNKGYEKQCLETRRFFKSLPNENDFNTKKSVIKSLIHGKKQKQQSFEFYLFDLLQKVISLEKNLGNDKEIINILKYKEIINLYSKKNYLEKHMIEITKKENGENEIRRNKPKLNRDVQMIIDKLEGKENDQDIFVVLKEIYFLVNEELKLFIDEEYENDVVVDKDLEKLIIEKEKNLKKKEEMIKKEKAEYIKKSTEIANAKEKMLNFYQSIIDYYKQKDILDKINDYPHPENEMVTEKDLSDYFSDMIIYEKFDEENVLLKIDCKTLFKEVKELLKLKDFSEIHDFYNKTFKIKDGEGKIDQDSHKELVKNFDMKLKEYNEKLKKYQDKVEKNIKNENEPKNLTLKKLKTFTKNSKTDTTTIEGKLEFLKKYKENKTDLILKEDEIKELVIDYGIAAQEIKYLKEKKKPENFIIPEKIIFELENKIEIAKMELDVEDLLKKDLNIKDLLKSYEMEIDQKNNEIKNYEKRKEKIEKTGKEGEKNKRLVDIEENIKKLQNEINDIEENIKRCDDAKKLYEMESFLEFIYLKKSIGLILNIKLAYILARLQNMSESQSLKCFSMPQISFYIFKMIKSGFITHQKTFIEEFIKNNGDNERQKKFIIYNYMVTGNIDYVHCQIDQLKENKIDFDRFLKNFAINYTIFINYLKDKSNFGDQTEKKSLLKMDMKEISTEIYFLLELDWEKLKYSFYYSERNTIQTIFYEINQIIICAFPFLFMIPFLNNMMVSIEWKIYELVRNKIMKKVNLIKDKMHKKSLIDVNKHKKEEEIIIDDLLDNFENIQKKQNEQKNLIDNLKKKIKNNIEEKKKKIDEFNNFLNEYATIDIESDHIHNYKLDLNILKNVEGHYMENKSGGNFNFEVFDSVNVFIDKEHVNIQYIDIYLIHNNIEPFDEKKII